jgi:hypothetical protein
VFKSELIKFLKDYVDCFAWNYNEMPSLSLDLVEHCLPIKPGLRPYKLPRRNINPDIDDRVKEEINWLLDAKFFRPYRYADWTLILCLFRKKEQKSFVFALFLVILIELLLKMNILCL